MSAEVDMLKEVTAKQWAEIRSTLEAALKLKQKPGEDLPTYAQRLAKVAQKVSDDEWEALGDLAQQWVNGADYADEKGEPIPLPPEEAATDDAEPADAETSEEAAAVAPPRRAGGARAPAKKAPAKKTAKPPVKKAPAKKTAKPPVKKAPATSSVKAGNGASRGRPARHAADALIKIEVSPNPHRPGSKSYGYYQVYEKGTKRKTGITLEQAIAAGVPRAEINWHEDRGIISFEES